MNIRKLKSTKISQEKFEQCMGCKDRGDSGANGGIRISTNEFGNLKVIDAKISVKILRKLREV